MEKSVWGGRGLYRREVGLSGRCRSGVSRPGFSDEEHLVVFSRVILMDRIKVLLSRVQERTRDELRR